MSIKSSYPTSRRGYLSIVELEQFANITVTDNDEAVDQINQAEEYIDAYVGFIKKDINQIIIERASGGTTTSITMNADHKNVYRDDYFKLCEVEIVGGTNIGERRKITASTYAGALTVDTAFTSAIDSTSVYRIYQLGKFPRRSDVWYDSDGLKYYKQIPEAVKRATASQVQFMIEMGEKYFASDRTNFEGERIGDYSYTKGEGGGGHLLNLIAPKAKTLLRGIVNRTGTMIV